MADALYEQRIPRGTRHQCENPVLRYGIGLPDLVKVGPVLPITIPARCRKCEQCLLHRRRLWTARALDECAVARRTWFGTLTVAPDYRFRHELAADLLRPSGVSSEQWPEFKFRCLASSTGREVTRMFKRLRKSGARFRYLLVVEAHKDGWPHFHLLVHEVAEPIRKVLLDGAWPLGFAKWRLMGDKPSEAYYVCKYLAKEALTRVRASNRYGQAHKALQITDAAIAATLQVQNALKEQPPSGKENQSRGDADQSPFSGFY